jgi:hypothetical protein
VKGSSQTNAACGAGHDGDPSFQRVRVRWHFNLLEENGFPGAFDAQGSAWGSFRLAERGSKAYHSRRAADRLGRHLALS